MKKLMLMPLLLVLSGCATYYYPAPEYAEETYYPADETVYVDSSPGYAGASHYPWWSMDYFYLGSHRHSSRWSIGLGLGYGYDRGWYDPFYVGYYPWSFGYYDYYSPFRYSLWYSPFYRRGYPSYRWNDHYWRHRYNNYYGRHPNRNDRGRHPGRDRYAGDDRRRDPGHSNSVRDRRAGRDGDRYSGSDRQRERDRRAGEDGIVPPAGSQRHPARSGDGDPDRVSRRVSVAPGPRSDRGIEVRSKAQRKPKPTRTEPVKSVTRIEPSPGTRVQVPRTKQPRASTPAYTAPRNKAVEVRRKAGSKQGRTRLSPVESVPAPATADSYNSRSGRLATGRQGGAIVRSPVQRKPGATKAQPVQPRKQASAPVRAPLIKATPQPARRPAPVVRAPSRPAQAAATRPQPQSRPAQSGGTQKSGRSSRDDHKGRQGSRPAKGTKRQAPREKRR